MEEREEVIGELGSDESRARGERAQDQGRDEEDRTEELETVCEVGAGVREEGGAA